MNGTGTHRGLTPGSRITVRRQKWPASDHYTTNPTVLGEDDWGVWTGARRGDHAFRDGVAVHVLRADLVALIPWEGSWAARWYQPDPDGYDVELYCDVTTPARWEDHVVTTVDLDLDVVRQCSGETILLDEDEFEAHRIELNYPRALVDQAWETADWLLVKVAEPAAPFDGTHLRWLDRWIQDR